MMGFISSVSVLDKSFVDLFRLGSSLLDVKLFLHRKDGFYKCFYSLFGKILKRGGRGGGGTNMLDDAR